ncbi:ankyrin repeat-containing domain protein [Xylaria arbuscula]|nr:ankyrin repeat-containing domain protein [Xylaria arbuscula]
MDPEEDHGHENIAWGLNKRSFTGNGTNEPKRRRDDFEFSNGASGRSRRTVNDYTVGWVCALPIEMAAAKCMLQTVHDSLENSHGDSNTYSLGSLHGHNIVIACLPTAGYGTNNAAIVASNMRRTFPSLRIFLLVGIGGGAPSNEHDVRLGDVVVSTAVIQYDMGKTVQQGLFQPTGIERRPVPTLMTAVSALRAQHELKPSQIPIILSKIEECYPGMREYTDRQQLQDQLFDSDYDHAELSASCNECDSAKLKSRSTRSDETPVIHYGVIASGNQVMKHAPTRDNLARQFKAICFEMEAAGLMESFPCLVVRGICDYSDTHKSKGWQKYASATAAAYANELLSIIPTTEPQNIFNRESIQNNRQLAMDSLSFEKIDARHSNIKSAHGKTCAWLLSHPDYIGWLNPAEFAEHHGLLWIHGKPGAGKSTLMKYIYTRAKENTGTTISFFFNARGDTLEKSTEGMYRSLLLQLLQKMPDLQEVLDSDDHHCLGNNDGTPWQIDTLQHLLSAAVSKLGRRRVMCFIDALDECSESEVRDMVDYFEQIGQSSLDKERELYICFSSRHYPTICVQYGRTLTLEDQQGHRMDLDKYVRNKLKAGKGKDVEPIRTELLRKSASVFMWVVLVVNILNEEFQRGRIFAVRKRLQETPAELSALFKDILQRDNKNMDDLLLCIQWILYAKLPLKPEEFYYAVVAGLDPEPQDLSEWDPQPITLDDMKRFVSSSSKGLAEVTRSRAGNVQFIHESVRDFLLKDGGIHELWPNLEEDFQSSSHNKLKECCYVYMKIDLSEHVLFDVQLPKATSDEAKALRQGVSEKFPLLRYATHNVLYYANTAATDVPQEAFLKTFDLEAWINLDNLFANYDTRRHTLSASLPYILAEHNFAGLIIEMFPFPDMSIPSPGERYRTPLFAAILNGHREAVVALLQSGDTALITALIERGLRNIAHPRDPRVRKGETPLQWAIREKCPEILHLLLLDQSAKDINLESREYDGGETLVSWAASYGNRELMQLLLERGANIESTGSNGDTVLLVAVKYNPNKELVQLLLERGANIKSTDRYGDTPLLVAAKHKSYNELVQLLLERGANIESTNSDGDTPLAIAFRDRNIALAQLLLDSGLYSKSSKSVGVALIQATRNGNLEIVQLLLDHGADIELQDEFGCTPLCYATICKQLEVAQLLLDRGANVESKGRFGGTILVEASSKCRRQIVQLLLDRGANVQSADEDSKTPLHYAVYWMDLDIVKQLLDRDADIESKDSCGRTPLRLAVTAMIETERSGDLRVLFSGKDFGHPERHREVHQREIEEVVQLLLDRGANVNAADNDGISPLSYATEQENEELVQLLLAFQKDKEGQTPRASPS